jgi:hypothetical protein
VVGAASAIGPSGEQVLRADIATVRPLAENPGFEWLVDRLKDIIDRLDEVTAKG